jgi:hypothetical protein
MMGHAAADPAIPVTKSRRRIAVPRPGTTPYWAFNSGHQNRNLRPMEREAIVNSHCENRAPPMSPMGLKLGHPAMSAQCPVCPKGNSSRTSRHPNSAVIAALRRTGITEYLYRDCRVSPL